MNEKVKFNVGEKVIIKYNPHDASATGILAKVEKWMPGGYSIRMDMAELSYAHPETGVPIVLPFGVVNFVKINTADLLAMAERFESNAASIRKMIASL